MTQAHVNALHGHMAACTAYAMFLYRTQATRRSWCMAWQS